MYKLKSRKEKSKSLTIKTLGLKVLIPVFLALLGLLFCLIAAMTETKKLAKQYIEDTIGLYVEQINKDIHQINNELVQVLDKSVVQYLPENIDSSMGKYYTLLEDIRQQNSLLKIRYKEVKTFFVYDKKIDLLIESGGTVFSESMVDGFLKSLQDFSRKAVETKYGLATWDFLETEYNRYAIGYYSKYGKLIGCVIDIDEIFSFLKEMDYNCKIIPYMQISSEKIVYPKNYVEKNNFESVIKDLDVDDLYEYQLGTIGEICVYAIPQNGVLQYILELQTVLVVLIISFMGLCIFFAFLYYSRLIQPLKNFVDGMSKVKEEQFLNQNDDNNILELEAVSDKFKDLLRKIQSLKITIYEKELNQKKAELEYVQEQIRPHFFLNCLSLIHGIADKHKEYDIVHITKVLSEYIRYNYKASGEKMKLFDEIDHVKKYIEIQKLRYGEDVFTFEIIDEDINDDDEIPSLILQTLIENSMVHGVNLDYLVEISLYITKETYQNEKFLYICVSDTGKGFDKEILNALNNNEPIVYNGRKHIGLQNIKRRLELMYGDKFSIIIQNMDEDYGAIVEIRIPI